MKFFRILKALKRDETAALSLDWPLATAYLLGLAQVIMTIVGSSVTGLGDAIVADHKKSKAS